MSTPSARILLVDDQPRNLDALEAILEGPEYTLVRAESAEEALLALLQGEFAAIVLDIRMPGVSGLELAHLIKQRRRTQHVPILFLTAHLVDEGDVLRGYGAGAVDYLSKPVNPEILRSKIAVFADVFRKTRALAEANAALEQEIAERERAQAALREANDALESRVRERTADLTLANQALRQSEQRLRVAVDVSRTVVLEVDLASRKVHGEADLAGLLGLPPGEVSLPLEAFQEMFHPDDRRAVMDAVERCLEPSGEGRFAMDHRLVRPDGGLRWIDVRAQACADGADPGSAPTRIIAAMLDITDRKLAEQALRDHNKLLDAAVLERTQALERSHERLRQAERLATVGTLAAGLGHDMSNLLLPVRARLSALAESDLSQAAAADIAAIREAAGYLQRLAAGLRLLAADPERARESEAGTDLSAWWRDVEGVFRAALPRGVRLEGECRAGLPPVAVPASRLTQAVFNLVQNAGEAMTTSVLEAGSGTIRIEAFPVGGEDGDGAGQKGRNGDGTPAQAVAKLVISDNGPGMPAEVSARCFEPYFSTKIRAVATGMGLPMVRAWIEAAGGKVELRTAPGEGTTFTIWLPAAPAASSAEKQLPRRAAGSRVAMSVDDRRISGIVTTMLAASGAAAVNWDGDGVPDAEVWVAAGAATPERVAAFLAQGASRRVVLLSDGRGPQFGPAVHSEPQGGGAAASRGRVSYLGRRPPVSELRAALLSALGGTEPAVRPGRAGSSVPLV